MNNISFICCISPIIKSEDYFRLLKEVENNISPIVEIWNNVSWCAPDEYIKEMGAPLLCEIWILEKQYSETDFINIKHQCMFYEHYTSINNLRTFNLNPGFVASNGMYLTTHKPNSNRGRLLISDNVWKEKQYDIVDDILTPNSNTFSEYLNIKRIKKFNAIHKAQTNQGLFFQSNRSKKKRTPLSLK